MERRSTDLRWSPGLVLVLGPVAAFLCVGCAAPLGEEGLLSHFSRAYRSEEPPPPIPDEKHEDLGVREKIRAEQVAPPAGDTAQNEGGSTVNQIPSNREVAANLKSTIDTDDPCVGELASTERCKSGLSPAANSSRPEDGGREITLRVVSSGSNSLDDFDPSRAVDEIGRGKPASQIAQSAGSDYLSRSNLPEDPPPVDMTTPDAVPIVVNPSPY